MCPVSQKLLKNRVKAGCGPNIAQSVRYSISAARTFLLLHSSIHDLSFQRNTGCLFALHYRALHNYANKP